MRQLLNNPWVVVGLCGVAIVILYFSADELDVPQVPPRHVRNAELPSSPEAVSTSMEKPTIDLAQLDWPKTLARDPFAPISHRAADGEQVDDGDGRQISDPRGFTDSPTSLRLTAVALEPEPRVAMINRKLVEEGDRIEDLRVTRIESDGVWLNGPSGPHHLGFEAQSSSGRSEKREKASTSTPRRSEEVKRSKKETKMLDGRDCSRSSTCS